MSDADAEIFDFAIIGAGVSGLTLAWLLTESPLANRSILLVDGARDDDELRTLSFWSPGPIALESLVRHTWRVMRVYHPNGARTVSLREHSYRSLFFADLQRETKARLAEHPQHRVIDGRLSELQEANESVTLTVDGERHRARWVFDSRFRRAGFDVDRRRWHLLWQHFHGWVVRTDRDVFEVEVATLLDFRIDLPAGSAFLYVLPYGPREALVEIVSLERIEAEPVLRSYLARVFGLDHFELVDREAGASPMTERPFPRAAGSRVRLVGIPAGRLKPSTGYALTRIIDDAHAVVRSLEKHGHPFDAPHDSWLYRILDAVLLELWSREPEAIPTVFAAMFAKNDVDLVLRFLDERASLIEILRMIVTLPKAPFVRAVTRWMARRLGVVRALPSRAAPKSLPPGPH